MDNQYTYTQIRELLAKANEETVRKLSEQIAPPPSDPSGFLNLLNIIIANPKAVCGGFMALFAFIKASSSPMKSGDALAKLMKTEDYDPIDVVASLIEDGDISITDVLKILLVVLGSSQGLVICAAAGLIPVSYTIYTVTRAIMRNQKQAKLENFRQQALAIAKAMNAQKVSSVPNRQLTPREIAQLKADLQDNARDEYNRIARDDRND